MKQVTQKMQGLGRRKGKGKGLLGMEGGMVTLTVLNYLAWLSGLAFKGWVAFTKRRLWASTPCMWGGEGMGRGGGRWMDQALGLRGSDSLANN